jgi:MFS transporter, SP family, arabinose:H+ symporter
MNGDMQRPLSLELPVRGSVWYLAGICLVASLGGFLFGFDTAVISGTVERVTAQFQLTDLWEGWFTSSALIGCMIGAATAGFLGDRFGRKPILVVSAVCFFFSALFCCIPPSFRILVWSRFLGGAGIGVASVLAPMYIAEFAPSRWRGRLVAFYQLSIVIGILSAYFSNWLLLQYAQSASDVFGGQGWLHKIFVSEVWRAMFGAGMIPAVLFLACLFLVPESPRWLAKEGHFDRALGILARITGREDAQRQIAEIQSALHQEAGRFAELFKPGLRMALLVGVMLSVFGQLSGVNIVVYYGPKILKVAGFQDTAAMLGQVGVGVINLIFTVIAMFIIDRLGRRPLLIAGMAVVTVILLVIGILFFMASSDISVVQEAGKYELQGKVSATLGIAIGVMIGTYMAVIALTLCAVIWVLIPEIYPNRVRGRAASAATFANWATNAFSAFIFPWLVGNYGMHSGFFAPAVTCLLATIFFWKFVPETKGKSLEEIERYWESRQAVCWGA